MLVHMRGLQTAIVYTVVACAPPLPTAASDRCTIGPTSLVLGNRTLVQAIAEQEVLLSALLQEGAKLTVEPGVHVLLMSPFLRV